MSRALVSVYDKTGLVSFVKRLRAAGCVIVSSGGTASALEGEGVEVTRVNDVTGAPEILGGRVKTLHPRIHGGILARGSEDDAELAANNIDRFDLVGTIDKLARIDNAVDLDFVQFDPQHGV